MFITPITLHLAMAVPVWIFDKNILSVLGVISIGIGDSFAGIVGIRYGSLKWSRNSKKSVQGTLASIISQFLFVYLVFGSDSFNDLFVPIIVGSLIESFTNHIDNLIVPLILITFFI